MSSKFVWEAIAHANWSIVDRYSCIITELPLILGKELQQNGFAHPHGSINAFMGVARILEPFSYELLNLENCCNHLGISSSSGFLVSSMLMYKREC
jgi:hypothetical protein